MNILFCKAAGGQCCFWFPQTGRPLNKYIIKGKRGDAVSLMQSNCNHYTTAELQYDWSHTCNFEPAVLVPPAPVTERTSNSSSSGLQTQTSSKQTYLWTSSIHMAHPLELGVRWVCCVVKWACHVGQQHYRQTLFPSTRKTDSVPAILTLVLAAGNECIAVSSHFGHCDDHVNQSTTMVELKYLSIYWMDYHGILFRHSWS